MNASSEVGAPIGGRVSPGFEPVRDAFAQNFRERGEIGASVVVMHRGQVVVDLYGGVADRDTARSWAADTPVVCFSVTKGLVAACFLVLLDRGGIDLDTPVAEWWPELGRGALAGLTPRMLLNHRAGLSAVDAPLAITDLRDDPERVHDAMVRQVPLWPPDTDQGYAACTYGLYTQELFRRAAGCSLGTFLTEQIARPLGMDTRLGQPGDLAEPARIVPTGPGTFVVHQLGSALLRGTAEGHMFRRVLLGRRTEAGRALLNPSMGPARFRSLDEPEIQAIELPWINALTTARGLARLYAALAGDGSLDGVRLVRPETLAPLHGRQSWSERDRMMQKPVGWSQGFLKEETHLFSTSTASFGHSGAGGALGWADPERELAIGYVMNRMDWRLRSPRALALCHAAQGVVAGDR